MAERTDVELNALLPGILDNLLKGYMRYPIIQERAVSQDAVYLTEGAKYPFGSSREDILDALAEAKKLVGLDQSLRVSLVREINPKNRAIGLATGTRNILLATEEADRIAGTSDREAWASYVPASARIQLWATAFEEAVHCLRRASGVSFDDYFSLPENPTEEENWKYILQEEEALVDRALNNGLLQRRFGEGVFSFGKIVLQPGPFSSIFSKRSLDDWAY